MRDVGEHREDLGVHDRANLGDAEDFLQALGGLDALGGAQRADALGREVGLELAGAGSEALDGDGLLGVTDDVRVALDALQRERDASGLGVRRARACPAAMHRGVLEHALVRERRDAAGAAAGHAVDLAVVLDDA